MGRCVCGLRIGDVSILFEPLAENGDMQMHSDLYVCSDACGVDALILKIYKISSN